MIPRRGCTRNRSPRPCMLRGMLWVLPITAWASPCPLDDVLTSAELAWEKRDRGALGEAVERGSAHLDCGSPRSIARWYRIRALVAQLDGDTRARARAIAASLAAYPLLPLPDAMRDDPSFRAAWYRAEERPLAWRRATFQRVNGLRSPLIPRAPHVGGLRPRRARIAGIGMGVVATGLYGAAWAARIRFDRTEGQPAAERLPAYHATNRLSVASLACGITAGTLVGLSFVL